MIELREEPLSRPQLDPMGQAQFAVMRGEDRLATMGIMGRSLFAASLWLWLELEGVPSRGDIRQARAIVPALSHIYAIDIFLAEVDNEQSARFLRYLGFKLVDDTGLLPIYEWSKKC